MYSSNSYFFDGHTSDFLSSFQTDCLTPNVDLLDAPVNLYEGIKKQKYLPERVCYGHSDAVSSSVCSGHPEFCPSIKPDLSPGYDSCYHNWCLNSRREAKRARVENIIKGMSSTGGLSESMLGRKELQEHPGGCRSGQDSPLTSQTGSHGDSSTCLTPEGREMLTSRIWNKPDRMELMTDVLKYELSRAVCRSVDSIFQNVPLPGTPSNRKRLAQPLISEGGSLSPHGGDVQTEALSLVVPKPTHEKSLALGCGSGSVGPPASESGLKKNALQQAPVRSKVSSRSPRSLLADPPSLHLHRVKVEPDAPATNYLYTLNVSLHERNPNRLHGNVLVLFFLNAALRRA